MKIFLLPSWYPSKEKPLNGIFFKEQAEALARTGVEVVVIDVEVKSLSAFKDRKKCGKLEAYTENGVKVYKYATFNYYPRMTELYLRHYGRTLKKIFKRVIDVEGRPDLVHIHSAIDAGIAYYKSGIALPYVITEHSTKYSRNILNETQKKYLNSVFGNAEDIMAVGMGLKKEVARYVDEDRINVVYNPVVMPSTMPETDKNKTKFRFFSLGMLTEKKGMDSLIKAFSKYRKELDGAEVYIGGDGQEHDKLKALIESEGLKDSIKLLGALDREQVAFNMANCDCFSLVSRFETFGIVYVEAMFYGKPVIATRTGGPDTFMNDGCGILVDVDDIDAIGKAMVDMVNNYERYNQNEIKKFCMENFSESVIIDKVKSIYEEVIGENNDH